MTNPEFRDKITERTSKGQVSAIADTRWSYDSPLSFFIVTYDTPGVAIILIYGPAKYSFTAFVARIGKIAVYDKF